MSGRFQCGAADLPRSSAAGMDAKLCADGCAEAVVEDVRRCYKMFTEQVPGAASRGTGQRCQKMLDLLLCKKKDVGSSEKC